LLVAWSLFSFRLFCYDWVYGHSFFCTVHRFTRFGKSLQDGLQSQAANQQSGEAYPQTEEGNQHPDGPGSEQPAALEGGFRRLDAASRNNTL
jgi:hypothetical protein